MHNLATPFEFDKRSHKAAHILIVDDDTTNCLFLETILKSAGFDSIQIANNGADALAHISQKTPDLILLDIIMPGTSGLDLCQQIKNTPHIRQMPIIFLSGLEGVGIKTKAFNSGGVDYIAKPFHKQEVLSRVMTHVKNGLVMRHLTEQNNAIRQELAMAEKVQRALLPSVEKINHYKSVYSLDLAAAYLPSTMLAGDYWSFLPISGSMFGILLCDFSGHGVPAALETVRFHSLLHELRPLWESPKDLLIQLNKRLTPDLSATSFATAQYALFNTKKQQVYLWGAGTPPLLHLHQKTKSYTFHPCQGFPLGIDKTIHDHSYTKVSFKKGDLFLFYSDALSEAKHRAKGINLLKAQNIKTLFDSSPFAPQTALDTMLKLYLKAPKEAQQDDLTLVCLQVN